MFEINFVIDTSIVEVNEDSSVTVGSDKLTNWDKLFGNTKPATINGDALLKLLTEKEIVIPRECVPVF